MKEYTLKDILVYHPDTGVFTWKITRSPNSLEGGLAGSIDDKGHVIINTGNRHIMAQRLAWYFTHGVWPSKPLVHINGKKDDNRIDNLKEVSRSELSKNSNSGRKGTTGLKGVYYNKINDSYMAIISHEGERLYLGSFKSKTEAHVAYQMEAAKLKAESN